MAENTEKTGEASHGAAPHKIWRNPASADEPVAYLGDYYPPSGRPFFVAGDLVELGFGPGAYTILAPGRQRFSKLTSKWQTIEVR